MSTELADSNATIVPMVQASELIAYSGQIRADKVGHLVDNLRRSWVLRAPPAIDVRLVDEGATPYSWTMPAVYSISPPSQWKRAFCVSGSGPNVSSLLDYSAWQEIDTELRRSGPPFNGVDGLCGKLGLPLRRNNLASSWFQISAELPARFEAVQTDSTKSRLEIGFRCRGTPDLLIEWLPQHEVSGVERKWKHGNERDLHNVSVAIPRGAERVELMLSFGNIEAADATTFDVSYVAPGARSENVSESAASKWEKIKGLGEGGQGQVFLARSPARVVARRKAKAQIRPCIGNIGGDASEPSESVVERLAQAIEEYNRYETPDELGALKEFKIPADDKEEEKRALGRLESEVRALQKIKHPAIVKLLDANVGERFIGDRVS